MRKKNYILAIYLLIIGFIGGALYWVWVFTK
ncbi:uncharacterized membrane protein YqaE (UPF0057 family) [Evansella vedderi]|uniref:Uncharacterized membrane protein YqaE (UPF0057 family) n=1 Tax=Evansella vedderi TaxID=38282 RepID=A0ABT9ZY03_9BACI|nr:uncharacterized membrane protein YqaE (UPF0057 family) [Evansella vedderi]